MAKKDPKDLIPRGKKSNAKKKEVDSKLRDIYLHGRDTISSAAAQVGVGPVYVSNFFARLDAELASNEEDDIIKRHDAVRRQSIEGYTFRIQEALKHVDVMQKQLDEAIQLKSLLLRESVTRFNESPLAQQIGQLDSKTFMILLNHFKNYVGAFASMSFVVTKLDSELRAERILETELQMELDELKMIVPIGQVLDALLEKYIAQKQNLTPALPKIEERP